MTAEFNRNVLHVLNRELDADFDAGRASTTSPVGTRSTTGSRCGCGPHGTCTCGSAALGLDVAFAEGEEMRTEISAKFRPDGLQRRARRGRIRGEPPVHRPDRRLQPLPGRRVIAETGGRPRSSAPPGHLDAAGCNVPSDRVLDAVIEHLRLEREVGGYRAVPDFHAPKSALAALVGADAGDVAFLESGTAAMAALLGGWRLPPGGRVGVTAPSTAARSCCCTAWRTPRLEASRTARRRRLPP